MKLRANETAHELAVHAADGSLEVVVDVSRFRLEVEETAPGVFSYRQGTRQETFHCVRDDKDVHLFWRGTVYLLREEREGAGIQRVAAGGLEAPMPGKVIAVRVAPGVVVAKGQELLVIEAMKMENALRAPRDGIVKSVAVKPGDMAIPGVILVELE